MLEGSSNRIAPTERMSIGGDCPSARPDPLRRWLGVRDEFRNWLLTAASTYTSPPSPYPEDQIESMCGICGNLSFDRRDAVDHAVVARMTKVLSHRGPDDEGFYFDSARGFGFRRVSTRRTLKPAPTAE